MVAKRKDRGYKCPKCGAHLTKGAKAQSGKQRWVCSTNGQKGSRAGKATYCYSTTNPQRTVAMTPSGKPQDVQHANPQFRRALGGVKRFVITAAQNATPIHEGFLKALKRYCEEEDAELIVIPLRYKNPTSKWTESQANEEQWSPALAPYLYNQRKKLNDNLILMADVKTQPTAEKPLSGFEGITHGESGIFGHTKLQLLTVPTPQGKYPKILTTTGAITLPNYTDSKAGKKGEFHHVFGACVVDIFGKKFHMYQINALKDGSFIHLDREYFPTKKSRKAKRPHAVVFGDTHRKFIDDDVEQATFGPEGIVATLNPTHLIFHDLHDGYAENPHHFGNPFVALAKHKAGFDDVHKEIAEDASWLTRVVGKRTGVIVSSNHDNFLWRWVINNDWRLDPKNSSFYLHTALFMVNNTKMTDQGSSTPDPFAYWMSQMIDNAKTNLVCLKMDESLMLGGVELGMHGHMGPNGSRGSRQNLRRIGVKSIIGHTHSPGIEEGCYQVGTSSPLSLEYTGGPSSWLNTHAVVYANGKRSLINVIDGLWRL